MRIIRDNMESDQALQGLVTYAQKNPFRDNYNIRYVGARIAFQNPGQRQFWKKELSKSRRGKKLPENKLHRITLAPNRYLIAYRGRGTETTPTQAELGAREARNNPLAELEKSMRNLQDVMAKLGHGSAMAKLGEKHEQVQDKSANKKNGAEL